MTEEGWLGNTSGNYVTIKQRECNQLGHLEIETFSGLEATVLLATLGGFVDRIRQQKMRKKKERKERKQLLENANRCCHLACLPARLPPCLLISSNYNWPGDKASGQNVGQITE